MAEVDFTFELGHLENGVWFPQEFGEDDRIDIKFSVTNNTDKKIGMIKMNFYPLDSDRKISVYDFLRIEKKTVEIGGTITTENKTLLMAKISFKNWEESWFTLAVSLDDTPVNTESLKVITPDSADAMPFIGEVSMNAMTFLTKLNQVLPEDYQLELFPMN